jgi:CDP-diacylglycerol--serine O-phosphatidyltransferase
LPICYPVTPAGRSVAGKSLTRPTERRFRAVARLAGPAYILSMVFQPFDPAPPPFRRRFKAIPVRTLLPNLITLLALCAGLTAIRLAIEDKLELALAAIVFAALLDGIDGRIARMLKGTSRFGAELDSLADFVNFGVAPALILYLWGLHDLKSAGWIAALVFAICAGLRLARFNVMIDDPNRPAWAGNFFTGIPAPAGAITVLLPIYITFLGVPVGLVTVWFTFFYTLMIALLMVSRLPVFSGKRVGKRVPPEMVLPVFVMVVLFFALLVSYPWQVLTLGTLAYLACLPLGWFSYREYQRKDAAAAAATVTATAPTQGDETFPSGKSGEQSDKERPARLN